MDGNSFRNLMEAYSEVYTQVDENLLGSLDKTARDTAGKVGGVLGREKAGKMPGANVPILGDVIKNEGERRGRAQGQGMYDKAKETIGGLLKQDYEYDMFDIILEYLVAEGYADTNKAAIAIMANMSEEWRQSIVEAEGSYGKTPKATAAYGKLSNERRSKPASEYSERGEKTKKVKSAEKHMTRSTRTSADHGGKKSTKPAWHSYQRSGEEGKGMTQKDRDYLRGQSEYGHVGYDGEGGGGSKPKGKKLERQRKTGVSAD